MKKILFTALLLTLSFSSFAKSEKIEASNSDALQTAASVDFVQMINDSTVSAKIFSLSGGDPAINGANLSLAVYSDPSTGWNVYPLANVRDFKLLKSAKKGFVKISLVRESINEEGGVSTAKSTLFINLKNAEKGSVEVEEVK